MPQGILTNSAKSFKERAAKNSATNNSPKTAFTPEDFFKKNELEREKQAAKRKAEMNKIFDPNKKRVFASIGSAIGFPGGLFFAYKRQSGFWGYVGWSMLFSIVGYAVGSGVDSVMVEAKK